MSEPGALGHKLKAMTKDAQPWHSDSDLRRTLASLQQEYNSTLQSLQAETDFALPAGPKTEQVALDASLSSGRTSISGGSCTGISRPACKQSQAQQQPPRVVPKAATCKCASAAALKRQCTSSGGGSVANQAAHPSDPDPRLALLGLGADDFAAPAVHGPAAMGLATEPLAVLRDVLNLDGSRDHDRAQQQQVLRDGQPLAGPSTATLDSAGLMLAQAQFESRLRGAYRSMLLQLQHRYQLERERQEEAHQAALREQEEQHNADLLKLAAAHDADLAEAAGRMERREAAWRAEVQRLEAQLSAAKAAAETSHSQVAAARAAAESLHAQLQLQRTTHEAEIQHVRQGSVPLEEHQEIVRRLKSEWEQALQQRERDYAALLGELTELRRQMSSATEATRSSGNSCAPGSTVSPPVATPISRPPTEQPAPAAPSQGQPAASTSGRGCRHQHQARCRSGDDELHRVPSEPPQHRPAEQLAPLQLSDVRQQQRDQPQCRHHHHHQQQEEQDQRYGDRAVDLRVQRERTGTAEGEPGSPASSDHSLAGLGAPDEAYSGSLDDLGPVGAGATLTPRGSEHGQEAGELPPPPPSSCSSRLSELVDAVVHSHRSSAARRGLGAECSAAATSAAGAAGDVAPAVHTSAAPGGARGGSGRTRGGNGWAVHSGGFDYPEPTQPLRGHAIGAVDVGPHTGGGSRGGCGDGEGASGDEGPGSPDQRASEITFDRWQVPEPPEPEPVPLSGLKKEPDDPDEAVSQRHRLGQQLRPENVASAAAEVTRRLDDLLAGRTERVGQACASSAAVRAAGEAGAAAAGAGGLSAARRRSPSPQRQDRGRNRSSWGRTGNPSASLVLPQCIRCGLNDATSPGCCRLHPALLSEPGTLRFTPEWMTCQAAGHTGHTPGCFVRSEHFYEPGLLLQPHPLGAAPVHLPAAAETARRQMAGTTTRAVAVTRGSSDGAAGLGRGGMGCGAVGGSNGVAAPVPVPRDPDRRSSGGGAADVAADGPRKAWGYGGGATSTSPLRRGMMPRSPARQPQRSPTRGGVTKASVPYTSGLAASSAAVAPVDSPSPKPRTRLPSPMRR